MLLLSPSVVSDSVQPHRQQPTRLPCPLDSPGKNTGVGCHFLLQCMKVKSESEVAQSCPTLSDPMDCSPPGSSVHGIFQTRVHSSPLINVGLNVFKPKLQGPKIWVWKTPLVSHSKVIPPSSLVFRIPFFSHVSARLREGGSSFCSRYEP